MKWHHIVWTVASLPEYASMYGKILVPSKSLDRCAIWRERREKGEGGERVHRMTVEEVRKRRRVVQEWGEEESTGNDKTRIKAHLCESSFKDVA